MHLNPSHIALLSFALAAAACGKKAPEVESKPIDASALTADLFPAGPEARATQPEVAPTTVVARVNGTVILRSEIDREVQTFLLRMKGRAPAERIAQMKPELEEQARENLITRNLLADEVKAKGITVQDADVDAAIEKMRASAPAGEKLEDALVKAGLTMDTFRAQLQADLQINKLLEQQSASIAKPTDADLTKYYNDNAEQFAKPESVQASHILISTQESKTDEEKASKRAKAETIRAQLVQGADFAEVASKESDCPSKSKGGDLGSFTSGQMVPPFEKAAFSQKVGEVGEVVETQFGFHIIKVARHDQAGKTELSEIREKLAEFLERKNQQETIRTFIAGLREKAKIELTP